MNTLALLALSDTGAKALAAAIAILVAAAVAIGMGIAISKALEGIARQPEAAGNIRSTMMLGMVLAESTAIYGFVVALIIIFLM